MCEDLSNLRNRFLQLSFNSLAGGNMLSNTAVFDSVEGGLNPLGKTAVLQLIHKSVNLA